MGIECKGVVSTEITEGIIDLIRSAEQAAGLDRRFSYFRLGTSESGIIEVELSSEEVFRNLAAGAGEFTGAMEADGTALLKSTSGVVARLILLAQGGAAPLLAVSSVVDVRKEAAHSSELLTQMIMGEDAEELATDGDWHLVRLSDGYHGWVRSWCVSGISRKDIEAYKASANALVDVNVGSVYSKPDTASLPVGDVVCGTRLLAGVSEGGFRHVTLPGGRQGYMSSSSLVPPSGGGPDRKRLIERAKRHLGVPYIWGGTSAKGVDCSGFVYRVFLLEGIELPRDSDRQAASGDHIPAERIIDDARTGDLLFFGDGTAVNHVAIYIVDGLYIHSYGEVRINSLRVGDEMYEGKLGRSILFARSVLG